MASAPAHPSSSEGQSISGLLLAGPGEIWVNAEEARRVARPPPVHRRPRARPLGDAPRTRATVTLLPARQVDPEQKPTSRPTGSRVEEEANVFAAALTMPAHLIREHYERLEHGDDCHARMCKLFAASGAAMGRRLHAVI